MIAHLLVLLAISLFFGAVAGGTTVWLLRSRRLKVAPRQPDYDEIERLERELELGDFAPVAVQEPPTPVIELKIQQAEWERALQEAPRSCQVVPRVRPTGARERPPLDLSRILPAYRPFLNPDQPNPPEKEQ